MHYSLFSFVQHSFSMVMNCVNQEPWLPSIGESPSKIFDVTTKLGNITDSQPLSNQEVIKAVTQEFKGKITCSGKWGKLITDWYSIEQATESLILWNMLLIGIHRLIVYYLCKKQLLILKKMNGSRFQSWKCGVETLCPISAMANSYVKCRAERSQRSSEFTAATSTCEPSAWPRFVLCWKVKCWWGHGDIIQWSACTCKLGRPEPKHCWAALCSVCCWHDHAPGHLPLLKVTECSPPLGSLECEGKVAEGTLF